MSKIASRERLSALGFSSARARWRSSASGNRYSCIIQLLLGWSGIEHYSATVDEDVLSFELDLAYKECFVDGNISSLWHIAKAIFTSWRTEDFNINLSVIPPVHTGPNIDINIVVSDDFNSILVKTGPPFVSTDSSLNAQEDTSALVHESTTSPSLYPYPVSTTDVTVETAAESTQAPSNPIENESEAVKTASVTPTIEIVETAGIESTIATSPQSTIPEPVTRLEPSSY
ncbi:hypothetical protein Cni_G09559 [Canna indica]|uniref:Uncharacterized protein n=1 Tax=Canna indica TaxID=4628 RepID=A0AAQ3Q6J6_9LILI|nr:hypothetical protein Cni_G09559 [Canna indica]